MYYNKLTPYFNDITIMIQEHICVYYAKDDSDEWIKSFLKNNNIDNDNILAIIDGKLIAYNVDSMYRDDNIVCKEYTDYIRLDGIVILMARDIIRSTRVIYGINPPIIDLHKDYMLKFIEEIVRILGVGNVDLAINKIKQFRSAYLHRELPKEYYREFNSSSKYTVIDDICKYGLIDIDEDQKGMIDISYNEKIIRYLYSLVAGLYLK
jgi:hypothetical protein